MPADPHAVAQAADPSSDIWKVALPAAFGLIGAVIGGLIQSTSSYVVTKQQRQFRLADDEAERSRAAAKLDADRSYARAVLARHLEAYARACAQAMWANDDPETEGTTGLPDFPEWPEVSWELLGANEMMKARDIVVRVDIQKDWVRGAVWHGASHEGEARDYYRDAAARVGFEAWNISRRMREEAGVEAFEFPAGSGSFAESLSDRVTRLDEQERIREERLAARRAAGEDDFDLLS